MTQAQVQAVILARVETALSSYATLRATDSMEDAHLAYEQAKPWVLVTLQSHEPNRWQGEDEWKFMVQASVSLQPGAQADTLTASDADIAMMALLRDGINSDASYASLRGSGVCKAEITAMAEDQQSESTINPHVFSCSTY